MAEPVDKKRATYQDVLDAPEHLVAEIIGGELRLSPRPGGPATSVASKLAAMLIPPFNNRHGGPGGWIILIEPELHLGDEIVVPDLAGWRLERLSIVPAAALDRGVSLVRHQVARRRDSPRERAGAHRAVRRDRDRSDVPVGELACSDESIGRSRRLRRLLACSSYDAGAASRARTRATSARRSPSRCSTTSFTTARSTSV